jgi:hypothetical protein
MSDFKEKPIEEYVIEVKELRDKLEKASRDPKRLDWVLENCVVAFRFVWRGTRCIDKLELIESRESVDLLMEEPHE